MAFGLASEGKRERVLEDMKVCWRCKLAGLGSQGIMCAAGEMGCVIDWEEGMGRPMARVFGGSR